MRKLRRALAIFLFAVLLQGIFFPARAEHALSGDSIAAEAAILIDADTGKTLFEKNADRAMYPASTTKIMTCLLALEYGNLYDVITIPQEAADVPKGSSLMPVVVGEQMSMRDLLYGLMLRSGNDAANAVAVIVAGSLDAFVQRMNERAAQLGMTGTHFANAHGYHADDHYTTARDLATLARFAMNNADFRQIVGTPGYIIEPTNMRSERLKMVNSNAMLVNSSEYYYEGMIGIKTGTTKAAGQTFVFAAERDGATLIGVNMKSGESTEEVQRWVDAKTLLDYGFTRYTHYSFADLYNMAPIVVQVENAIETDPYGGELTLSIANITGNYTAACVDGDASALLADFQQQRQYAISADLTAPIPTGTIIGTVSYPLENGETVTATLVASRTVEEHVEEPTIADYLPFLKGVNLQKAGNILKIGAIAFVALLLVRAVVRALQKRKRRAQRRRKGYKGSNYYRNGRDSFYNN